jgi:hypothetical protein
MTCSVSVYVGNRVGHNISALWTRDYSLAGRSNVQTQTVTDNRFLTCDSVVSVVKPSSGAGRRGYARIVIRKSNLLCSKRQGECKVFVRGPAYLPPKRAHP